MTVACSCGKSSGNPAATYVVRFTNGQTKEFNNKTAADIAVTKNGGGTIEVKRAA